MTIKELKTRWIRSKIYPALFYLPVEKKESSRRHIYITLQDESGNLINGITGFSITGMDYYSYIHRGPFFGSYNINENQWLIYNPFTKKYNDNNYSTRIYSYTDEQGYTSTYYLPASISISGGDKTLKKDTAFLHPIESWENYSVIWNFIDNPIEIKLLEGYEIKEVNLNPAFCHAKFVAPVSTIILYDVQDGVFNLSLDILEYIENPNPRYVYTTDYNTKKPYTESPYNGYETGIGKDKNYNSYYNSFVEKNRYHMSPDGKVSNFAFNINESTDYDSSKPPAVHEFYYLDYPYPNNKLEYIIENKLYTQQVNLLYYWWNEESEEYEEYRENGYIFNPYERDEKPIFNLYRVPILYNMEQGYSENEKIAVFNKIIVDNYNFINSDIEADLSLLNNNSYDGDTNYLGGIFNWTVNVDVSNFSISKVENSGFLDNEHPEIKIYEKMINPNIRIKRCRKPPCEKFNQDRGVFGIPNALNESHYTSSVSLDDNGVISFELWVNDNYRGYFQPAVLGWEYPNKGGFYAAFSGNLMWYNYDNIQQNIYDFNQNYIEESEEVASYVDLSTVINLDLYPISFDSTSWFKETMPRGNSEATAKYYINNRIGNIYIMEGYKASVAGRRYDHNRLSYWNNVLETNGINYNNSKNQFYYYLGDGMTELDCKYMFTSFLYLDPHDILIYEA